MATYGRVQRPEAVLQRAEEFISVGKDNDALNALHEIIRDRRHKQWSPTHELIMSRHLELCVKLRNASIAKDALYQYKALTQQVAVSSLENVMKHLLRLAESKAETAQKESIEKLEEIDDLDSSDAPEALLLSVVSGAVSQDRMDRTVLSPWLRFLWDSYRNCLDLLRNNSLVENLYHQIARQSFAFCIKYQRRNEFRKLCDLLRLHLSQLQKNIHSHSANNQRINLAESLAIMQETRLIQLDTAIQMELWGEAYKSTEDLHNLMQLCKEKDKRTIKPQSFVNYYDKLSLIFWKGGNFLFHSAALLQKFTIYKDMKKTFSGEEATEQATRLLLAALSIADDFDTSSILTKHLDMEDLHLGNVRILSTLLRLPIAPTRKGILREIAHLSVPDIAQDSVAKIYRLMEVDFAPLEAAKLVNIELEKIKDLGREDYSQYIECIRAVVATKILKGLTNIYDAIPIDRMSSIIPFYTRSELEHFLVHITKQRFLKAQVDHRENCIRFGPIDATVAGDVEAEFSEANVYKSGYESMRIHLTRLFELLANTAYQLDEDQIRARAIEHFNRHRQTYEYRKDADHERIMQRKKIIEHHKESSENLKQAKIQEQQKLAAEKDEKKRKQELERLKREQEEGERQRRKAEAEAVQEKIRLEQLEKIKKNPLYNSIVKEKGEEAVLDPESLVQEQRKRMDVERKEQTIRQLQQERKFDYFVRAFNIEEREIAKQISNERRQAAPALFEECEERRIEQAKIDRAREEATFAHLNAAKVDAITFIRGVVEAHKEDFERKEADFDKRVAALKEKKLQDRKIAREKDRRRKWEQSKKEEKERIEQERNDAREAEREERQAAIQSARNKTNNRGDFNQDRREGLPESKADAESTWRSNNSSQVPRPPRGPPKRDDHDRKDEKLIQRGTDGPDFSRLRNREFIPERRQDGPPESKADAESAWRSNNASSQAPRPSVAPKRDEHPRPSGILKREEHDRKDEKVIQRGSDGPDFSRIRNRDVPQDRRDAPPESKADVEPTWRAGPPPQLPQLAAAAPQTTGAAPQPYRARGPPNDRKDEKVIQRGTAGYGSSDFSRNRNRGDAIPERRQDGPPESKADVGPWRSTNAPSQASRLQRGPAKDEKVIQRGTTGSSDFSRNRDFQGRNEAAAPGGPGKPENAWRSDRNPQNVNTQRPAPGQQQQQRPPANNNTQQQRQ
jgi:translation initiation factor 3 subunit A